MELRQFAKAEKNANIHHGFLIGLILVFASGDLRLSLYFIAFFLTEKKQGLAPKRDEK